MSQANSFAVLAALLLPPVFARFIPSSRTDNQRLLEVFALTTMLGLASQGWVSDWTVRLASYAALSYVIVRIGAVRRSAQSASSTQLFSVNPLIGIGLCAVCLLIQRDDPGAIFRGPLVVFLLTWSCLALSSRNSATLACLAALLVHFPR